jgi:large subunit ribosomal protein L24
MARIRKGDLVVVRSGRDAGRTGRVLRMAGAGEAAVVEGLNMQFKHLRRSQKHPQGGRIRREAPLPLCKLMPVDPETKRGTRVGWQVEGGEKRRVARRSGAVLEAEPRGRGSKSKEAR